MPAEREDSRLAVNREALDLLLDMELPVTISFGAAHLPLGELLTLSVGSMIELDRSIGDPVDVLVDGRVIARGEVVVVEGDYGVRITELSTGTARARTAASEGLPEGIQTDLEEWLNFSR